MSEGKLCGRKIKVSLGINRKNHIELSCGNYEGHEGDCSAMIYHVVNHGSHIGNYRLGSITWKNNYEGKPL
jgi:hypothetical protein